MELENKTILITGASSGIGRALALKLLQKECRLALAARRIELLNEMAVLPHKAELLILKCDVGQKEENKKAFREINERFGNIDIAILNAGISIPVTAENFNSSAAEEIVKTNFLGNVYWIELLLPSFVKKGNGIIAAVSSLADNRAYGLTFYNPCKAALSLFLEGLYLEMKKYKVKIITIKPGFVNTGMTEKKNFIMPFLLSSDCAADKIIKGLEKEKKIIQFPFMTVLLTRVIGLLPLTAYNFIYNSISKKG
jgi:short-subunit dehydrogenase